MTGINTAPSESVEWRKNLHKVKSDYDNLLLFFYFQMKHDIWSNKQKQAKFFFFKPKRYPSDNSKGGHPNPPKYILHTY